MTPTEDKELIEWLALESIKALRLDDQVACLDLCERFLAAYLAERGKEAVAIATVGELEHGPFNFVTTPYGWDHLPTGEYPLFLAPQPAMRGFWICKRCWEIFGDDE